MSDTRDEFSDLFKQELLNISEILTPSEQYKIDQLVRKQQFFNFSFYTFNIYYALAIFSGFMISISLGIHYLNLIHTFENKSIEQMVTQVVQQNIKQNQSLKVEKREVSILKKNVGKNLNSNLDKPKSFQMNKFKKDTIYKLAKNDTLKIEKELVKQHTFEKSINSLPELKPKRKTIIVTQRDTIIQFDTLKTKFKSKK